MKSLRRLGANFPVVVAISIEIALACVVSACAKNEGVHADAGPAQADGSWFNKASPDEFASLCKTIQDWPLQ